MLSDATKIRIKDHLKRFGKLLLLVLIVYFVRNEESIPDWGKFIANIIQWLYGIIVVVAAILDFGAEIFNIINWVFQCVFSLKIHKLKSAATKENEQIIARQEEMERKREYECQKQKFKDAMSETEQIAYNYGCEDGYAVGYEEGDQARRRREYSAQQQREKEEKKKEEKERRERGW